MTKKANKFLWVLATILVVGLAIWAAIAFIQRSGNDNYRDMQTYIGLTEHQGVQRAEQGGLQARIVERDGEMYPITEDFSNDRVNFTIDNEHISKAEIY